MRLLRRLFAPPPAVTLADLFAQEPPGVSRRIAPHDQMFTGNKEHYFGVGLSALRCIRLALLAAGKEKCQRILDLPCGHGRVLRTLKATFPEAELTACDLLRDGVDFCAKTFSAAPIYSSEQIDRIPLAGPFDLIWCGSLFTHLDVAAWTGFLRLFHRVLDPGGVLVFTTHGPYVAHRLRTGDCNYFLAGEAVAGLLDEHARTGFGYRDYKSGEAYGVSVSAPAWVLAQLTAFADLRVLTYTERGWDNHQDVVACVRET